MQEYEKSDNCVNTGLSDPLVHFWVGLIQVRLEYLIAHNLSLVSQ